MMTGAISGRRAYLDLTMHGPSGQESAIEFVLDTGFTGVITLPPAACLGFGLRPLRLQPARLADGSRILLDVYEGILLWDGAEHAVEVLAMDGAPLIGMTLLDGFDVHLRVTDGGPITIQRF